MLERLYATLRHRQTTPVSASSVPSFAKLVVQLRSLQAAEHADGSRRRARCISTVVWLLSQGGAPTVEGGQGLASGGAQAVVCAREYVQALAMLEWLLANYDDAAHLAMQSEDAAEGKARDAAT
eukprot:1522236-Pleurochrysis_carterae.AAC.1